MIGSFLRRNYVPKETLLIYHQQHSGYLMNKVYFVIGTLLTLGLSDTLMTNFCPSPQFTESFALLIWVTSAVFCYYLQRLSLNISVLKQCIL